MRLGIFGGSFDPVHNGHLLLAECCREQAKLDRVLFVPAAVPPHKQDEKLADDKHRVEMLELAIAGHEAFEVSHVELERGGVTYTFETLEAIRAERRDDQLFFLMGGDSLVDLPTWRNPQRICELATPLIVPRPGSPVPDVAALKGIVTEAHLAAIADQFVEMPQMDLSSTDLRARANENRSLRYRTPMAVIKYIEHHGLYS